MKKFILLALAIMLSATVFAQLKSKKMVTVIQNRASALGVQTKPYDFIYIIEDSTMYISKVALGSAATGTYLLASPSRYAIANMTTFGGVNPSYYVDTATAQDVYGVKTFYAAPSIEKIGVGGNASFPNLAIGKTTLSHITSAQGNTVVGYNALHTTVTAQGNTVTGFEAGKLCTESYNSMYGYMAGVASTTGQKNTYIGYGAGYANVDGISNVYLGYNSGSVNTSGNENICLGINSGSKVLGNSKLVISNKVGGADTAIIYGVMGVTVAASSLQFNANTSVAGTLSVTGAVTGTALTRGQSAFTTTATRKAIAITGATANDYYIVSPVAVDHVTLPIAADFVACFAKTDSLIVMRPAGTTSALKFNYIRLK
jgi:hypothetical protein